MTLRRDVVLNWMLGVFGFIILVSLFLIEPDYVVYEVLTILLICAAPLSYYLFNRRGKMFYFPLMMVMSIFSILPAVLEPKGGYGMVAIIVLLYYAFIVLLTIIVSVIYELRHPVDVDPAHSWKATNVFIYVIAAVMAFFIIMGVAGLLSNKAGFIAFFIMLLWTAPVLALLFWQKARIRKKKKIHKLSILTTLLVVVALAINIVILFPMFVA